MWKNRFSKFSGLGSRVFCLQTLPKCSKNLPQCLPKFPCPLKKFLSSLDFKSFSLISRSGWRISRFLTSDSDSVRRNLSRVGFWGKSPGLKKGVETVAGRQGGSKKQQKIRKNMFFHCFSDFFLVFLWFFVIFLKVFSSKFPPLSPQTVFSNVNRKNPQFPPLQKGFLGTTAFKTFFSLVIARNSEECFLQELVHIFPLSLRDLCETSRTS